MAKKNILHTSKLQKAEKAIKAGKLNDAEKILTKLCQRSSADASTWLLLASIYGRMNNFQGVGDCCQKALQLEPKNTTAMNYLGNIYTANNQHDKAIEWYEKSLTLNTNNISTLYNLSTLYYFKKNINKSLSCLHKIIEIKPEHFEALTNLTRIYCEKSLFKHATQYCLKLNEIRPGNVKILEQLGACYYNTGQTDKARDIFQQTLKLVDNPTNTLIKLSENELNSNQVDSLKKSAEYLLTAFKANPTSLEVKIAQAGLWYRQGDFTRAQKQIKELINEGHINANLIITYSAFCHHFNDCEFIINHGKKLLDKKNEITGEQRIRLHFNLGRVLDKLKNHKEAFQHYQQGNNLDSPIYSEKRNADYINRITTAYSSNNLKLLKNSSIKTDLPVFIIGMPRSGTSLVEQIISSHSDVHGAGELRYISQLSESFIPEKFDLIDSFPEYIMKLTTEQLNTSAQHYLDKLGKFSTTALRITNKMPQNFLYIGLIKQLFPKAKIIHCSRHPLDTILSIYFQNFSKVHDYSFRLENIAHYYQQYQHIMNHWKQSPDIEILDVPYTNLVNNFEDTCRSMISYIELEWDEQCLNFHNSEREVTSASFDQVRSPIYKSSLDRWKHYEEFLEPLSAEHPEFFR